MSGRKRRSLLLLLLTAILFSQQSLFHLRTETLAFAQEEDVIRVDTNLAVVPFRVEDRRSRPVSNLSKDDFDLFSQGRRVGIDYFAKGTDEVELVYALDASGSSRDTIVRQRETALSLFSRFGRDSRVAVLRFAEQVEIALAPTTDSRKVPPAFLFTPARGHRTAIFDAALASVRLFNMEKGLHLRRRIIILLSDGLDTASTVKPATVIREAQSKGVSIYVIHLPLYAPGDGRLVARRPSSGFRELATKTGGRFFSVGDARSALDPRAEFDMRPIFSAIFDDLQSQYLLGTYAVDPARTNQLHSLEVRIKKQGDSFRVIKLR